MSAPTVEADTALEAWMAGGHAILEGGGELNNLLTVISQPCILSAEWLTSFSPRKHGSEHDDIRDVIDTIFPVSLASKWPQREHLYAHYLQAHDRAKRWRRNRGAWGTYFERLIRFPPNGNNQLDIAIQKLQTWQRHSAALVFHLSSPAVDTPRILGGPCWQFAELLWNADDTLDLVVVYRNHDFFNKVLGNFIGLGQLLKFICEQSGRHQPGRLVCHSVHAYNDSGVGKLKNLMNGQQN